MKILVTGGAGFIGSNLVRHLVGRDDCEVVNLDKLTYAGNLASLSDLADAPNYTFEPVDICDLEGVREVFARHQPDAVMHLAAESHVDRSIDGPGAFVHTNILGTYNLLQAALEYWRTMAEGGEKMADSGERMANGGVGKADGEPRIAKGEERKSEDKSTISPSPSAVRHPQSGISPPPSAIRHSPSFRFLHVSTDEVYGSLDSDAPGFSETHPYQPHSPYSASKAASDHLARSWHDTYGLPVIVTNCSNNYGPYQFPEKLIPVVILKCLQGNPIPVYGKGENIRDWLYVEDHVRALTKVLERGTPGETYNIGGNNELRNIDLVRMLCGILDELAETEDYGSKIRDLGFKEGESGRKNAGKYEDLITFVKDRPGHDLRYAIDASKIERELGWVPKQDRESGFVKTVKWYLDNKTWWQEILNGTYRLERLGVENGG